MNRQLIQLSMQRLELRFVPLADRYARLIGLVDDDHFTPLFESIEGSDEQPWPESPPLQEVHLEHREGGQPLALCVGMAGDSHFSMSVELRAAERMILFDAACRVKQPLPEESATEIFPLGSSYHAHVPVEQTHENCVEFRHDGDLFRMELHAPEQASPGRITMGFDSWRIEPTGWVEGPLPRTLRWRYALRQLSSS